MLNNEIMAEGNFVDYVKIDVSSDLKLKGGQPVAVRYFINNES